MLLQIPNIMYWSTSQVANMIGAISAVATVGTLAYALYLERKNSKKINDLALIANELREQNRMTKIQLKQSAYPEFQFNFVKFLENEMKISLLSIGQKFITGTVADKSETFDIIPMTISDGDKVKLVLSCKYKVHKPVDGDRYVVTIDYKDIYGNQYRFIMTGNGEVITSWTTQDVIESNS